MAGFTKDLMPEIKAGKYSYGSIEILGNKKELQVGNFCSISAGCKLLNRSHNIKAVTTFPFLSPTFAKYFPNIDRPGNHPERWGMTTVKNDVFLGRNTYIKGGITIGNGVVTAFGSVVIKDIPDYAIVGGNPAQIIRYRFSEQDISFLLGLAWWNWPDNKINNVLEYLVSEDIVSLRKKFKRM